ncbi:DivIVA domain-containing protein [Deinococcus rubellus]|uniref:DivIVA domain-containing protein n=1 Tax=Deinococcus rubellus TaxID=1889240 RepID=A0ABY5YH14_9DEIO|nr:DivIVA domain-containing protein [Deinococcus rubellus]UWX63387.1 DivIVA domain-containing protein [Deinococcus rubellus]
MNDSTKASNASRLNPSELGGQPNPAHASASSSGSESGSAPSPELFLGLLPSTGQPSPGSSLTPLDVQHRTFAAGWRGYRQGDVHAYLAEVAQALEAGLRERAQLTQRLQELQRQVNDYKEAEDELRRTVVAAERIGHELKEQSRQEAMLTLQSAENRAALLSEGAKRREQEALARHESRLRELESTFSLRRAQLESLYQAQEHELEHRARERSATLEREFSARYADLSGRLSAAHAEYAQFMSQYRAVSQAFAQAANTHLLPEAGGLPHRQIGDMPAPEPRSLLGRSAAPTTVKAEGATLSPEAAAVQIEEQRFS